MAQHRLKQQEAQIRVAMSDIVRNELKDPRIGFVSVTAVELSKDLSYCKVFVSILGDKQSQSVTLNALVAAQGFVRRQLAEKVNLRKVPEVVFHFDDSIERGSRINRLLREIDIKEEH